MSAPASVHLVWRLLLVALLLGDTARGAPGPGGSGGDGGDRLVVQQAYVKASNPGLNDWFGMSIDVSGDTAVVGAPFEDGSARGIDGEQDDDRAPFSGAAYVFVRRGSTWVQEAYLKASNAGPADLFGWSVSISGETIVVGAYQEASASPGPSADPEDDSAIGAGAAYVFTRRDGAWVQEAYLKASNPEIFDNFGHMVAISGDTIAVGAPGEDSLSRGVGGSQANGGINVDAGAVYVFARQGGTWVQEAYVKASNSARRDFFGHTLALDGDWLAVGAPQEDSAARGIDGDQEDDSANGSGAVYVFERRHDGWRQDAYVKASNAEGDPAGGFQADYFGGALALSGRTLIVGAPFEDGAATGVNGDQENNDAPSAGAVYVFVRRAGWSQEAYLKAPRTRPSHLFGTSVAFSENRLAVGAVGDASSARGVNGDTGDEGSLQSGAAFVFERRGGTWSPLAYVKASNTGFVDSLNFVALDGATLWTGSVGEDSDSSGVNGPDGDVALQFDAGAAYVFDLEASCGASRYGVYSGANTADLYGETSGTGSSFLLELSRFEGAGTALLLVSLAPQSLPLAGGTLLVDPRRLLATIPVALQDGSGRHELSLIGLPANRTLFAQAVLPQAKRPGGLVLTNGLSLAVCR